MRRRKKKWKGEDNVRIGVNVRGYEVKIVELIWLKYVVCMYEFFKELIKILF